MISKIWQSFNLMHFSVLQELQDMAAEVIGIEKFHQVAMGQGQADIAMQLLHDCARNGEWLCLKNLHLVNAWLPTLEKVNTITICRA